MNKNNYMNKVEQYIDKLNIVLKLKNKLLIKVHILPNIKINYNDGRLIIYYLLELDVNMYFCKTIYNQYNINIFSTNNNIIKIKKYIKSIDKQYDKINKNEIMIYDTNYKNFIDILNIIYNSFKGILDE